jgi:hypothetical protein
MTDVATLGFAIDSSQANSATTALQRMTAASAAAEKGATNLAQAGQKSETQMRAIESAAKRAGISTAEYQARTDAFRAATDRMTVSQGKAVQAIVSLSDASRKGANDNNGLTQATDKSNSSFDRLANTLTRRVLFAFAAKEVRDLATYVWGLNAAIAATADSAQRSGINGQAFQGLSTAAAYKGVSGDSFNGAMVAFNQQVDLAKSGLGDLKALLSINGKTVSDTATTFGVIADLVKNAGSEAQKFSILRQAGLPADAAFVKLMEQGAEAIKQQGNAANKLSQTQLEEAAKIDAAWQRGWTDFENWGKKAVVNVFSLIPKIFSLNPYTLDKPLTGIPVGTVTRGPDLAPPNASVDLQRQKDLNAQAQPRLGLLGPMPTVQQQQKPKPEESRDDSGQRRLPAAA